MNKQKSKIVPVLDILTLFVNLVFQRKVEVKGFDLLIVKHQGFKLVLFILQMFYLVRKPHRKAVIATV